jgi:hypothetical protein
MISASACHRHSLCIDEGAPRHSSFEWLQRGQRKCREWLTNIDVVDGLRAGPATSMSGEDAAA